MPKFKKKDAISVDAVQWTTANAADILALTLGFTTRKPKPAAPGQDKKKAEEETDTPMEDTEVAFTSGQVIIRTPQGDLTVNPSDWLVKGHLGEFYAVKPDQFTLSYEPTA
jgi:hypothetical protein